MNQSHQQLTPNQRQHRTKLRLWLPKIEVASEAAKGLATMLQDDIAANDSVGGARFTKHEVGTILGAIESCNTLTSWIMADLLESAEEVAS